VTSQQALDVLASGRLDGVRFDPRDLALVEAPADAVATHPVAVVAAEPVPERERGVEVAERSPGFVRLRIETARDGVLVHSANYSEGWRAFVDGAPAPLWRVDGLVQGVRVSAGRHEVRLEYLPKAFVLGAAISLLSGLTAGAAWIRRRAPEPLTTSS